MGLGLSGLRLGLGQQLWGGGASAYLGLSGAFDYYIDAENGSDSNEGSQVAPWKTLGKIESLDAAGGTLRVRVLAGVYNVSGDHIDFGAGGPNGTLEVVFEPGCIMDGTVHGTTAQNPIYHDAGTIRIYGNGLLISNFNGTTGGSPNGLGYGGTATLIAYNVTVDTVQDGISGHATGAGFFYDCHIKNGYKWCVANVDNSTMEAYRCVFDMRAPGLPISSANGAQYFEDCVFLAGTTDSGIISGNDQEFVRCQLGTLTAHVTPQTVTPGSGTITVTDSFINVDIQAGGGTTFTRCYGFMSARVRNTAGAFVVQDSVLVGGQNGGANILYCNSDFGGACQVLFTDNVIETANQISSFNATQAGYVIAASSSISGNQLFGGAAWDADLAPVISGTITTDPQIGSADSYLMADYASAAGLAGFGSGDVVAMVPQNGINVYGANLVGGTWGVSGGVSLASISDGFTVTISASGQAKNTDGTALIAGRKYLVEYVMSSMTGLSGNYNHWASESGFPFENYTLKNQRFAKLIEADDAGVPLAFNFSGAIGTGSFDLTEMSVRLSDYTGGN